MRLRQIGVEVGEVLELGEAREDVLLFDRAQAFEAESFDVVAGQHAADDHGGLERLEADIVIPAAGEVAGEAAGEGVARAGGIVDILQRVGRAAEEIVILAEKQTAVFAFFTATMRGPRDWIFLPALIRLVSLVSSRASLSLRMSMSTRLRRSSRAGWAMLIQRSIVSAMTNFGFSIWSSTCSCKSGAMLARRTKSHDLKWSGSFGAKVSKTLRATERVSRVFMSHMYSPDQRKVLPVARCTPSRLMPRSWRKFQWSDGKSSPTMATRLTGEK